MGFHLDGEKACHWLLRAARQETPALVLIEKGNMIKPGVLRQLRTLCRDAIIVPYTDDDMYRWSNRTWSYTKSLRHYDFVFTTKSYNADAQKLPRLGPVKSSSLTKPMILTTICRKNWMNSKRVCLPVMSALSVVLNATVRKIC